MEKKKKKENAKLHPYQYELGQSPFYGLKSTHKLASILNSTIDEIDELAKRSDNYKIFSINTKSEKFVSYKKPRIVQEPKPLLRRIHVRILNLFQRIIVPEYLHSCIKGRSYISNAKVHIGQGRALKLDIKKFYPSTKRDNVYRLFLNDFSCRDDIATIMSKICCCNGILPTGSPISPVLSFFVHRVMFDEIHKLAIENGLIMTCYVDDIVISGKKASRNICFEVQKIIHKHGLSYHKIAFFKLNQPFHVTGVVVNDNKISLPYSRQKRIRMLKDAYQIESDVVKKKKLLQRLAGAVGEASQIEATFIQWSNNLKLALKS
jgi:RNA-directed DNA polymerase